MLFICINCCIQLRNSYEFLKMCSESKLILESYVDSVTNNNLPNIIKNDQNTTNDEFNSDIEMFEPDCDISVESPSNIFYEEILSKPGCSDDDQVPLTEESWSLENNNKLTKQGLEIIALGPNDEVPKIEPNISLKTNESDDTDESSQSSERVDSFGEAEDFSSPVSDNEAVLDFLPVSVEIIESDTEIYNKPDIKKKLPILKLKLNKQNKFQIVGKKIRCKICPTKVNRKTVYRCSKCFVPICLSHALPFCKVCVDDMPTEVNERPRDIGRYPFFRVARSLKRACGFCRPIRNRKSRSQCNDCAKHVCGEHKQYLCEFCAISYSSPRY